MSRSQDQRDRSFRQIVVDATARQDNVKPEPEDLARLILDLLHERGLAIHDPTGCIRPSTWQGKQALDELKQPTGRAMTTDEQIAFGILNVSDDLP